MLAFRGMCLRRPLRCAIAAGDDRSALDGGVEQHIPDADPLTVQLPGPRLDSQILEKMAVSLESGYPDRSKI